MQTMVIPPFIPPSILTPSNLKIKFFIAPPLANFEDPQSPLLKKGGRCTLCIGDTIPSTELAKNNINLSLILHYLKCQKMNHYK